MIYGVFDGIGAVAVVYCIYMMFTVGFMVAMGHLICVGIIMSIADFVLMLIEGDYKDE